MPKITQATPRRRYRFGRYTAAFFDKIVAAGPVIYEFIMAVYEPDAADPYMLITSERNDIEGQKAVMADLGLDPEGADLSGRGSHFLCIFKGERHRNLGDSDAWAEADEFEARALQIISQRLGEEPTLS